MEELLNKIGQLNNTSKADYTVVLGRTLTTCIEMLRDRGYNVTNDCRTIGDISYKIEHAEFILCGENAAGETTLVYFHNEERIGVKHLRMWSEQNANCNIIIVSLEGPTAFTKKEAEQSYKNVQFFIFKDVCKNITKHSLVPKHEKVDPSSLPFRCGSDDEWPKLYTSDPIAQYYNFKPGDLIRITRTLGYPEPVYYYRLVCQASNS